MPNRLRRVAEAATRPLLQFARLEASSGIVLLIVTALALALANSAWAAEYHGFWQTSVGAFGVERSLEWLVNDGLMVVFFFVVGMEIFALANAGVSLTSGARDAAGDSVLLGVVVGLCVGKPLGVVGLCWLSQRTGLAALPPGIGFRHLVVLGLVAGVGFTMALFIAKLAFADERLLEAAKLGVLVASAAAGVVALAVGRFLLRVRAFDS